jgi:hypothetical protein
MLAGRPPGVPPAAGPGPADDPDDEVIWKRHKPPVFLRPKVLLAALVVLIVAGALFFSHRKGSWPPPANCARAAIKGSVGHVRDGYPVYWVATGPNTRYAITLGASSVRVAGGQVRVTGSESMAGSHATVIQQPTAMTGCRQNGRLTMHLPSAEYSLRLWKVDGDTATQVARARLDSDG